VKAIWKYNLHCQDVETIRLPANSKLLTIKTQFRTPCLWALVDLSFPLEDINIKMRLTGEEFEDSQDEYIGTTLNFSEDIVLHFFKEKK